MSYNNRFKFKFLISSMKKLALLFICLVAVLLISGCIGGDGTGYAIKNCHDVQKTAYRTVNEKNCDYNRGCVCKHESWAGLGACDVCECSYTYTERVCD